MLKKEAVAAAAAALGLLLTLPAVAQTSPVGLWKSIDDATGKPTALIRITEHGGELRGNIEKLFLRASEEAKPICTECTDARKGQPVLGMMILDGMRADGEAFTGGRILDPDNGKVYQSRMTLSNGGKKLQVRGYLGVPMLGRTQTWVRDE